MIYVSTLSLSNIDSFWCLREECRCGGLLHCSYSHLFLHSWDPFQTARSKTT